MITCVGIAGAGISSANWHADAGESITGIDSDNNQTKIGILIIAHGSSSESWCAPVRATVANVSLPYPVELGFLEKVPGEPIEDAVDKLNSHGVSEIIAVPLFVSSSSNHISEIEYILGLGDMIPGEDDLVQVNTTANITLTGAMDDHWIISSILADNAADFGEDPSNKTAVLVAHGVSDDETIFAGWNESSASLAEQTLLRLRHIHNLDIKSVCYSFINLNETLHPDRAVRAVVEEISSDSTPVVLSRILSPGYHTKRKIPALLENLTYLYDNETALATHPALSEWIDISVYEAVSDLSFSAYHGENGEIVELTIEEAVAGHEGGKLCPCVAVAWRASQFALSEVWSDVDQSDLKITSAHPSDGHEETFLYILNNSTADYTIEMPEGTDPKNLTTANYIYTFTSKSTGDSVTVRVKDDAFPDKLFDLRMKCKAGTATPDEKKAFKLIKNELKDGFLYLPMDELFDAEVVSDLSFSVYDGKNGEIIELTIEGAAAMHDGGKLCPSVAASWRASQFALSDIWGCVPRSDLGITSAHPSDGHEATFLYILNNSTEDYVVKMPEGTDTTNLSTENYVYTFVRKSTGDSVTVRVKDGIIPDEFLELRKKLRAKTATPDEIKVFKLIKDELKARLMYLPASELFDSEVTYSKFDTGILVVAHGSPREMWCAPVRAAVHNVDLPYPVELGFLEFVPGETINAAVDRLDKHGAREIIAIPLFVSSHSDHIAEVEYVLGLRDSLPGAHHASEMSVMSNNAGRAGMTTFASEKEAMRSVVKKGDKYFISRVTVAGHPGGAEEEELVPVETDAAITLTGAIDDHWLVGEILADRARALSTNPANETAVLVAHGADNETDIAEWIDDSKSLAEQVDLRLRFISDKEPALDLAGVRYSFLFHNETLHPNIKTREVVEDVSTTSDALVVPFMVSSGFFTGTLIPQMELANLTYAYDGDALLPHPKIADLIEIKASEEFTDLAFPVYDSESGETVNLTIEGAAAGHDDGELCLCVAVSFRVSQFALSEVWSDVDQSDLKITSAYPSDGHEETFLYILNNSTADYTVDMPEGTDPKNLTKANYVYTFTRKSTEESVTVRVKDGIFLDELFELRKKCKAGTATPDEKKAFKLIKRELKDRFMYLPIDGLFEIKSPSLKGDVNGDGMVTTADAAIVLEMATSGEWKEVADVNGDGRVTSFDALMIVQAAAGKIEV